MWTYIFAPFRIHLKENNNFLMWKGTYFFHGVSKFDEMRQLNPVILRKRSENKWKLKTQTIRDEEILKYFIFHKTHTHTHTLSKVLDFQCMYFLNWPLLRIRILVYVLECFIKYTIYA